MKKVIAIIILLLTIFLGTACSAKKSDAPDINLKFDVTNLTDEDFKSVGTSEVPGAVKEDFKNIEFTLEVKNGSDITNRKITIPELKVIINSSDTNIKRYWFGQSSSQDNTNENFAKYTSNFVFYSKGLDEQGIKDLFKSAQIKVSWTFQGKNQEQVLNLGDVIHFK